jgi:hypothetical protein
VFASMPEQKKNTHNAVGPSHAATVVRTTRGQHHTSYQGAQNNAMSKRQNTWPMIQTQARVHSVHVFPGVSIHTTLPHEHTIAARTQHKTSTNSDSGMSNQVT